MMPRDFVPIVVAAAVLIGPLLAMIVALFAFRNAGQLATLLTFGLTALYYGVYWLLTKLLVKEGQG